MLHLYDSKSARIQPLNPVTPGKVGIYLCGATVQGSPHVGHLRAAVSFDTLIRWLRRSGYEVTYVRNVTDIDDKILTKSAQAGWDWWAWAYRYEREFTSAYDALGVQAPTYEPRATGHIPDQIDLVRRLVERGHAYDDGAGNVYFDVHSQPDYGSLTRQRLADMRTTEDEAQIDAAVEAGKRDPRDFALWKATKPGEPATASWDSPWGRGRPGWHLECSAMSRRYLGDEFDIHGGGIDLRFPHHENEQAQSHGAGWGFARHWVHNAWVTIKGEKMSKSLGNSLVVAELLKRYDAAVLRLALGTVHHRSTVEFSEETLADAAALWERLSGAILRAYEFCDDGGTNPVDAPAEQVRARALPAEFTAAMDEDLNLAGTMAVVHATLKALNVALSRVDAVDKEIRGGEVKPLGETHVAAGRNLGDTVTGLALDLRAQLDVLGLDPLAEPWRSHLLGGVSSSGNRNDTEILNRLLDMERSERDELRAAKDWPRADAQRNKLARAGIGVEDTPSGSRMRRL